MSEIMDRARGIGKKTGIDVARMYLLPGLLLFSIVASEALEVVVAPPASQDMPPPGIGSSPLPFSPANAPPPTSATVPPVVVTSPPPPAHDGLFRIPPPSPALESPPPADEAFPSPAPPPATVVGSPGDTWNESEKAGVVIASVAALLQVAVVAFLLIKRHQMLSTVKYDDIDDLEYDDHPRDSSSSLHLSDHKLKLAGCGRRNMAKKINAGLDMKSPKRISCVCVGKSNFFPFRRTLSSWTRGFAKAIVSLNLSVQHSCLKHRFCLKTLSQVVWKPDLLHL